MAVKTATLDDFRISKFEILAYGPPGAGKTFFIQYLPRPFVFDIDRGLKTLARLPSKPELQFLPRVDAPALTYDQIMLIVARIAADPAAFGETIVLDNLGELERQMLFEEARKEKRDYNVPEQIDYRPLGPKILALLTALKSLPVNLYVTVGETYTTDRAGNVLHVLPDLTAGNARKVPRFFDEVYYFSNPGNGEYTIQTTGNGIAYAKTRLRIPNNLSHKGVATALINLIQEGERSNHEDSQSPATVGENHPTARRSPEQSASDQVPVR